MFLRPKLLYCEKTLEPVAFGGVLPTSKDQLSLNDAVKLIFVAVQAISCMLITGCPVRLNAISLVTNGVPVKDTLLAVPFAPPPAPPAPAAPACTKELIIFALGPLLKICKPKLFPPLVAGIVKITSAPLLAEPGTTCVLTRL